MNWTEYPLIKPTIGFILGIILSQFILSSSLWISIGIICLLLSISIYLNKRVASIKTTLLSSLSILGIFISLGCFIGNTTFVEYQHKHYKYKITKNDTLIVRLTDDSKVNNSVKTFGEVLQVNQSTTTGKILLYLKKDSISTQYKAGDIIAIKGHVQPIKSKTNPEAFDYKRYLSNIHIYYQLYVDKGQHKLIVRNQLNTTTKYALQIRRWGLEQLQKALPNKDEFGIASALILGERNNLSHEIYNVYAETGAVHVLAVSGLHVGIITFIFVYLLGFVKSKKSWIKILKLSLILILVWSYALITGGAPAVMRASLMFSLIYIGKYWFDNWNTYNILAFSALILLTIDPLLIFQVGFQFSYLALISILFFYQLLYKRCITKYKIINKITALGIVSIAAQILVFPLTIFYFHKIPTYFILSGVFAVSLAPAILSLGIITLVVSNIPILFKPISLVLSSFLKVFTGGIKVIHNLPMSSISDLWLTNYEVIIIYIALVAMMAFVYKKHMVTTLTIMSLCIITLLFLSINHIFNNHNLNKLTVYSTQKKQSHIEVYHNRISSQYKTNKLSEKEINFNAQNHRIKYGMKKIVPLSHTKGVFNFGSNICYAPSLNESFSIPKYSDYLILVNNYNKPPKYTLKHHSTNNVIIDNSISYYQRKKWIDYCKKNNIQYHDIRERGAFTLNQQ